MSLAEILNKKSPISESKRNRKKFVFGNKRDAIVNSEGLDIYHISPRIREDDERFYVLATSPTEALDRYMEAFYSEITDAKMTSDIRRRVEKVKLVPF